ncbi:MAG: NAD+ synthase [Gammaproteobacteria bacterium]|nr:NAD+ synthase [Gammaproteobacteria bacterium]
MKIALAQLNLSIGGIEANADKIIHSINHARDSLQADLIVFSELALTGYPPEDLLFNHACQARVAKALASIIHATQGIDVVLGYPRYANNVIYNSACLIQNGRLEASYDKQLLPNYAVFDERRYFKPGSHPLVFSSNGIKFGLLICEDIWGSRPATLAKQAGAEILLSIHASPFESGKSAKRHRVARKRVIETNLALIYLPSVGGQDELVFDGAGFAMNSKGDIAHSLPQFAEAITVINVEKSVSGVEPLAGTTAATLAPLDEIYQALVFALHDYIEKNHFPGVLIGLSGGIDSALTLAIAVDALGADRVEAILMPSRYTADMSNEDAIAQAKAMQVAYQVIPIEPIFESFTQSLSQVFAGQPLDLTEENLQARCRGTLLMALSNKFGKLVLTTSNKSESAVGYSTLYGDMAGGFSLLKDIYKTEVYQLAKFRNAISPIIPERVITRAPSAELRSNQTDQDSLPDYGVLDSIIKAYIEDNLSETEIVAQGHAFDTVTKVIRLIKRSEYKRRQAPIGPKISIRAFGKDWRAPISSGF